MPAFGPRELIADVFGRDLCVACGACVDLCPYFRTYRGKTVQMFPCDLPAGKCYADCPKAEVDLDILAEKYWGGPYEGNALGHTLEIMTARAGKKTPKGTFQAGGTASSLIAFALQTGLIEAAILTDQEGLIPVPRMITRAEDAVTCASSKYTAAPTLSGFNRALRNGYSRLGVVATPCQATALAKMRTNPLDRDDFRDPVGLVVGLFCTWAVDTRGLVFLLSSRLDPRRVRKMDIPPPPAEILVLDTEEGRVEIPLGDIRQLIPKGCLICPDMTAEWADVSVGVLEGEPNWNTLIVRTQRGQDLVKRAEAEGWLVTGIMPDENRGRLSFSAAGKKSRALRRALEEGLVNTTEGNGRSSLRINAEALQRITRE
ncbi:MAG: Coenzyme F420 hydrogenase/dehydrogenase, beta subunit C-terminal domain [Deltaproteobacteria bacterium]|nr:Coenzyme F420 hydrogenase/dehydrogenase, beta subunit C-terminal domain [Deltaproteobacteria bacterium]